MRPSAASAGCDERRTPSRYTWSLLLAHSVVGSDQPLLEVADRAVCKGNRRLGTLPERRPSGLDACHMLVACFLQADIALQSVGIDSGARCHIFLEKGQQRRRPEIRDYRHAYSPRCPSALLNRNQYESRLPSFELAASSETGLSASNPGVIDLHSASEWFTARVHHCPAKLVKHHPCRFVVAQPKLLAD